MQADAIFSLKRRKFSYILLIMAFTASCLLMGCEKSNQNNRPVEPVNKKYDKATILEGVVSDNHGPVKTGHIRVTDNNDQLVSSAKIQDNGHYSVDIPSGTVLPVVLTFYPDSPSAAAEPLITAVVHTTITKYDINPRTTAIAKKAQAMGGYTPANLILAAESAASVPDANKTTAGFRGDPTKQYGGWH